MCDKDIQITSSKAASKQDSGSDGGTTPAVKTNLTDLKSVMTEMLSSFKTELLTQVNESISQVYRDFEQVEVQDDNLSVTEVYVLPAQSGASLLEKITNFADETGSQSKTQTDITASENKVFKSFVEQFVTGERTGPAIDHDLATLVNDLLTEKLPTEKLEPVQDKYLKPENYENLIAPKINKPIWQQLKQETNNTDSAFQKIQQLSLSSLYAVLQAIIFLAFRMLKIMKIF